MNRKNKKTQNLEKSQKQTKIHQIKQNLLGTEFEKLAEFERNLKRKCSMSHNDY